MRIEIFMNEEDKKTLKRQWEEVYEKLKKYKNEILKNGTLFSFNVDDEVGKAFEILRNVIFEIQKEEYTITGRPFLVNLSVDMKTNEIKKVGLKIGYFELEEELAFDLICNVINQEMI